MAAPNYLPLPSLLLFLSQVQNLQEQVQYIPLIDGDSLKNVLSK